MKLSEKATIKINYPEADFWIIRRGSEDSVGTPTKQFNPEHIGVKITSDDLLPSYLFYSIQYLHSIGYFKKLAKGTLRLVNIQASDVKNISFGN